MSAPEIVLLSIGELGSGAHEAHLRTLAGRLSGSLTIHEVALVSWRCWATARGREMLERQREAAARVLSGRFVVRMHEPRHISLRWSSLALRKAIEGMRTTQRPIVHCRGHLAAHVAALARREGLACRILHDVRGDRVAEVAALGGEAAPEVVLERERYACAEADAHACVSVPLRDLLVRRHGVEAEVFPCAADTDTFRPDEEARHELRAHLGAGERFLLGYVGSAAGWQRPDAVAALLPRLRRQRPDASLLVLTPDLDAWQRCLEGRGISVDRPGRPMPGAMALLRQVPHAEVPRWMAALDATALLRQRDAVNLVASPIKFGESLACGVPVLVTEGIGDASALVRERGIGAVFEDLLLRGPGDEDALGRFLERQASDRLGIARACRESAEERWSWKEQEPRWRALYDRLGRLEP